MENPRYLALPSTENAREYWRQRSVIDGTDWTTLGTQAARALWRLGLTSSIAWRSS
jgi:hypothetical protein